MNMGMQCFTAEGCAEVNLLASRCMLPGFPGCPSSNASGLKLLQLIREFGRGGSGELRAPSS